MDTCHLPGHHRRQPGALTAAGHRPKIMVGASDVNSGYAPTSLTGYLNTRNSLSIPLFSSFDTASSSPASSQIPSHSEHLSTFMAL